MDKAFLIVASSKLTIKLVKDMSMEEIQSGSARMSFMALTEAQNRRNEARSGLIIVVIIGARAPVAQMDRASPS